ncbi:MAG: mechanosensitive ion channel family protein [Chloroflexi bacterium]|nr:MAG: mechanosensitive ion channel family protein [Chloroflexota bacterium]MBL1195095.1 mechanosensitive ion channel family protein [Chloroflexota bacterium]NOH12381.1 mechanosensitive ion channel family protein [Chloroflexota bacterium]
MLNPEMIQYTLTNLVEQVLSYLPMLLTALLLLFGGWLLARLLSGVVRRIAQRLGIDDLVERSGLAAGMQNAGIQRKMTDLIALLGFWLVWLYFILAAIENLGLSLALSPLQALLGYLPNIFAAILTLVIGALLAQVLGRSTQAAVATMGVEFHESIGRAIRMLLLVITGVVAVEQLGFDLSFLTATMTNLITIAVAGFALAFGLGGRDIARNVLASYYVREQFELGAGIVVDGQKGTLESIGTVNSEIAVEDGHIVIPNTRLIESATKILD